MTDAKKDLLPHLRSLYEAEPDEIDAEELARTFAGIYTRPSKHHRAKAQLIAAAVNALPALLDRVEELERKHNHEVYCRDVARRDATRAENERDRLHAALSEFGVHKHWCQVVVSGLCGCGLTRAASGDQ